MWRHYLIRLLCVFGFWMFGGSAVNAAQPMPEVYTYLQSNTDVLVDRKSCGFLCSYLLFTPTGDSRKTGVVFYPGAFIASASYAPLAFHLAERGYRVALANFPFNFALLFPGRAEKIFERNPDIEHWVIGGHSLGGVAASKFVAGNAAAVRVGGVFYLASYPDAVSDLSDRGINVVSLYGENDEVLKRGRWEAAKANLPVTTVYQEIAGGNHAQMGYYGDQKGDGVASISRDAQQAVVLDAIAVLLEKVP